MGYSLDPRACLFLIETILFYDWRNDLELKQEVLNVMNQLAQEGMTMVVVTHEMSFAQKVGTRLIYVEHGKISVDGNPREIISNPPNDRLKDFLVHVK